MITQLDTTQPLTILGDGAKRQFIEIMSTLEMTRRPIDLVGDPGTGKSHMLNAVLREYGKLHQVPAYLTVLDQEATKASIIMGHRIKNGSLEVFKSVVAEAMETGGIVGVDELTHAPTMIPLMFNTILDSGFSFTSVGDVMVRPNQSGTFRIVFAHNRAASAGNSSLPPSFASRVLVFPFDYPTIEAEATIAKKIMIDEVGQGVVTVVPDAVIRYITSYMREIRTLAPQMPLSARNVASAGMLLVVKPKDDKAQLLDTFTQGGGTLEASRSRIAQRIYWRKHRTVDELNSKQMMDFMQFVSQVGIDQFKSAVFSAMMFHLDVEGVILDEKLFKEKMVATLI
jgi:MoxR-like ATPase